MNGAIFDSTFNIFFRLKYAKLYDAALATPMGPGDVALGEIGWALIRGGAVRVRLPWSSCWRMGLVHSAWALLAIPVALLIGFAFAGVGHGRDHVHAQLAGLRVRAAGDAADVPVLHHVLPAERLSAAVQLSSTCTPLYQGIALLRGLTLGDVGPGLLWHVLYLAVMGAAGLAVACCA